MKITSIAIRNFKSIERLAIEDVESALIIVGKNSVGKTVILEAILTAAGLRTPGDGDFFSRGKNIEIRLALEITQEDLQYFNQRGLVSKYRRFDLWEQEFLEKIPTFREGRLEFTYICGWDGHIRYQDAEGRENRYIRNILPKIHYIDHRRNIKEIQEDILIAQSKEALAGLREDICMFNSSRKCWNCFQCIGVITQKSCQELNIFETVRLLEYKLYHLNLGSFVSRLNDCFTANCGLAEEVQLTMDLDPEKVFQMETVIVDHDRQRQMPVQAMSDGSRSLYIFSLLEAYLEENSAIPSIIMIEDPEIYLHPQMQKIASEILYRLSRKNQVIFSTHSPNLIFNFQSRQIRQVVLDEHRNTAIHQDADINEILSDLGYSAADVMNVSFVFIVEGKQDSSRLPMLLEKYYSEIYDSSGHLQRIAIVATNSCTNIKTYANLKYINQLYLKDQFLMIRDSDGQDPEKLKEQLCSYYRQREQQDQGNLPRVQPKNVLVLKYYSFENYFLDPKVMAQVGVIRHVEQFYEILTDKYRKHLWKLGSVKKMLQKTGIRLRKKEDFKRNIETIKTYVRGHNLFDIYYGRYKGEELDGVLRCYIEVAPRETFQDILEAVDAFVYFENRKK